MNAACKFKALIVLLLLFVPIPAKIENEEDEIFVATSEWKEIKKGQKIPKGLHVRINLETGVSEAKLLDNEDTNGNQAIMKIPSEVESDIDGVNQHTKPRARAELEEALKNINKFDLTSEEIDTIKTQFRSYDDIKKQLESVNLSPKMDSEIIQDLLRRHKKAVKEIKLDITKIRNILEDLDILAHQIDNAVQFVNENGFNEIIYPNFNSTNLEIRKDSLRLFSSLVQNNPKVQIHALETGATDMLLRMIVLNADLDVKLQTLSALGCLLRRFPLAQRKFVENGGLTILFKVFDQEDLKLHVKFITLINDLVREHQYVLVDNENMNQMSMLQQYSAVNIEKKLGQYEWCANLNKVLYILIIMDETNHDSIEKCLQAMQTTASICTSDFSSLMLVTIEKRYGKLALEDVDKPEEESNSAYFNEIKELCNNISSYINPKSEL